MSSVPEDGPSATDPECQTTSEADPIEALLKSLSDGGPPVDFEAVDRFIAGRLEADQLRVVRARIVRWKGWHHAYWQTMLELAEAELESDCDESEETHSRSDR